MTRIDPTNATIWIAGILFGLAIWACAIWGAWDIGARAMQWLMRDVGSLNGCVERGLVGGECSAWALEGL